MTTGQVPTILVAYPKGFSCYGKFERKVSTILSNLSSYKLAFLADYNEFISRYFSSDIRAQNSLSQVDEENIDISLMQSSLTMVNHT